MSPLVFVILVLIVMISCVGLVAYIQGNQYFKDTESQAEANKKHGCNDQL